MRKPYRVILIEDDSKKIEDILEYVKKELPDRTLTVKQSYQSGMKEILENEYDLLLLDMSIPTYDKTPGESGGHYQKFGGYTVLRELKRKRKTVKTILITMFDDFGESDLSITLAQIDESFKLEFSEMYLGFVFYNSRETKWKEDLNKLLELYTQ